MVFEMSVTDRGAVWSLWQALWVNCSTAFRIFFFFFIKLFYWEPSRGGSKDWVTRRSISLWLAGVSPATQPPKTLRIFEQSPAILCGQTLSFWEAALDLLLGLSRDYMLNHGPQVYYVTWPPYDELGIIWPTKPYSWACTAAYDHHLGVRYICDQPEQAWKAQLSYMNKWSICPRSLLLLLFLLSPNLHGLMGTFYDQLTGREHLDQVYRWFYTICKYNSRAYSYSAIVYFWKSGEGKSSQWTEL